MKFQFIDKDVAERFETDFTGDPVVRVPNHHMGKLSKISVETAEVLIKLESNLVRLKEVPGPSESAKKPVKEKSQSAPQE